MSFSSLRHLGKARVNEGSHSFTYHPHFLSTSGMSHTCLSSSCRASPHFGRYSFLVLLRVGGWVGLGGWLH